MLPIFLQRQIIFRPTPLAQDYVYQFENPHEELFLKTTDNAVINALHFKQANPKGIILYFHGNADNLARWGKHHKEFMALGYDFFIIDYRGFGKSQGLISENDFYKDAIMTYQYVAQQYATQDIIIYGRSLGTAIAAHVASQYPARQLFLETPYDNMRDLFLTHIPILPLPKALAFRFPTDEFIQKVHYPITIFHGTNDYVVPYKAAVRLQQFLKPIDEFITIPDGSHKNLLQFSIYQQALARRLNDSDN